MAAQWPQSLGKGPNLVFVFFVRIILIFNLKSLICIFSLLPLVCHSCGSLLMGLVCLMTWMMPNQPKTQLHALPCPKMIPMWCLLQGGRSPCLTWWLLRFVNILMRNSLNCLHCWTTILWWFYKFVHLVFEQLILYYYYSGHDNFHATTSCGNLSGISSSG